MSDCAECLKPLTDENEDKAGLLCHSCRLECSPCLACGAKDEYQSGEMCIAGEGHCPGSELWG